jgi:hypothetical protein
MERRRYSWKILIYYFSNILLGFGTCYTQVGKKKIVVSYRYKGKVEQCFMQFENHLPVLARNFIKELLL